MKYSLGTFLQKARKNCRLTLRDVQEKIGVSNAYLSQLENGKISSPSPNTLFQLSKLYQVSYEHLMSLAGYPSPSETQVASRIATDFNELTPEEKERVKEYIEFLKTRRRNEE
jgi:transcriptional regulator with XRE-family HTH domain